MQPFICFIEMLLISFAELQTELVALRAGPDGPGHVGGLLWSLTLAIGC